MRANLNRDRIPAMQRIVLGIEYDGSRYCGWQRQHHHPSIQENLEQALSCIASESINIVCAGRTDTGVHASGQVVHFDTQAIRSPLAWVRGTNSHLPKDIRVTYAQSVSAEFHARFSARARRYCYVIINREHPPGIWHHGATWIRDVLDVAKMDEAAQMLLGKQDFSAFRSGECQAKSPIRTVQDISVRRVGEIVILEIEANAFLHHMVRNIVGTLIPIGKNHYDAAFIAEVLASRDRRCALMKAPPNGLYLVKVSYPDKFELPFRQHLPWFFQIAADRA